jgi:trehalose 6-phosphate phosphatase
MAEPPFGGRMPVFAGDDTTDEDGFAAVNRMGGISIKIGSEPSSASHRAGGTPEFLDWFIDTARRLARSQNP